MFAFAVFDISAGMPAILGFPARLVRLRQRARIRACGRRSEHLVSGPLTRLQVRICACVPAAARSRPQ